MPSTNTAGQKRLLEWFNVTEQGRDTAIPRIQSSRHHCYPENKGSLVQPFICVLVSLMREDRKQVKCSTTADSTSMWLFTTQPHSAHLLSAHVIVLPSELQLCVSSLSAFPGLQWAFNNRGGMCGVPLGLAYKRERALLISTLKPAPCITRTSLSDTTALCPQKLNRTSLRSADPGYISNTEHDLFWLLDNFSVIFLLGKVGLYHICVLLPLFDT